MESEERQVQLVTVGRGRSHDGKDDGVMLMLTPGAMTTVNEEPVPGVFLLPSMARHVAYMLLVIAEEQELRAKGLIS